jgi:hypothetical protein
MENKMKQNIGWFLTQSSTSMVTTARFTRPVNWHGLNYNKESVKPSPFRKGQTEHYHTGYEKAQCEWKLLPTLLIIDL